MASFASVINPIIANIVNPVVEFMFALALIVFVWGVVEMLMRGSDATARSTGRNHMLGGIIGIFIMMSAWGIINLISNTLGQVGSGQGGQSNIPASGNSINPFNSNIGAANNTGTTQNTGTIYNPPPTTHYNPLQVSCSANTTFVQNGTSITWTAYASGGTGSYNYTWSGTDNLYGFSRSLFYNYTNPGQKTASVTVSSNGQTITQNCSNSVNVGGGSGGSF
jgi:hypothetical protein